MVVTMVSIDETTKKIHQHNITKHPNNNKSMKDIIKYNNIVKKTAIN